MVSRLPPQQPIVAAICDGLTWRPGEIEFAGTGVVTLFVCGLRDSVGVADIEVLMGDLRLNVEYVSEGSTDGQKQINARLPRNTRHGEYKLCVRASGVQSAEVPINVIPAKSNPRLERFAINLHDEEVGVHHRFQRFYLLRFQQFCRDTGTQPRELRALDCGCGNGISVEHLARAGFQAYGIDMWRTRVQQWLDRPRLPRSGLCVADGMRLPFSDESFDLVISSGVLEHIGVDEGWNPLYCVRPRANQTAERRRFIAECLRVLRRPGRLYLDHPNGAFPVDFWHPRDHKSGARWHWPSEKFLPTFDEVRTLVDGIDSRVHVRALSPAGRFTYQQSGRHWYGRLLRFPAESLLKCMRAPGFRWLAKSPLNPYLVLEIER